MNILFICTGNTCRSPMAEGYLNSKNIDGLIAFSAGLCAFGEPISQNSHTVLMEKGIDMSGHVSCPATSELCDEVDKIVCISPSHKQILLSYGVDENKLFVLGNGIAGPYGEDIDTYRRCRDEIFSAVDALFPNIKVRQSTLQNDDAKNIAELEAETERLDEELFGSAASDYVRAAEIDKRKSEIEEELLSLYELVM